MISIMKPKTLAGKSLATTTVHGLRAFLRGESLLCNFFSHNITSCSMTKRTSSNEFRTVSIEFWLLRYFSNKRDIIFSTSLSKRIKLSTRLRRGCRVLVAEMISAILDQGCIPLAEITVGAKLHFWAACGPSVDTYHSLIINHHPGSDVTFESFCWIRQVYWNSHSTSDLLALVKPLQWLSLQLKHLFPPILQLYNNSLLFPVDISIWQVFRQVRWGPLSTFVLPVWAQYGPECTEKSP